MENLIGLLTQYKYIILFPLAIVEGPIIAIIAGFLSITGILNPWIAFVIIVLGDIAGDSVCYVFGRWGAPEFIKKISRWFGIDHAKIEKVRIFFNAHSNKTIFLSKITLGIGVVGIYLAGNARISYKRFIAICLVTSAIQYVVYLSIGVLFGSAYIRINHYLNYFASLSILIALAIAFFFFIKSTIKRL